MCRTIWFAAVASAVLAGQFACSSTAERNDDGNGGLAVTTLSSTDMLREFRGVWVATVANADFPSSSGKSAADQERELDRIVETAESLKLNAILFQVRPEGDAFYRSRREPWSAYLTGTQGADPGYDPLDYLIRIAHAKNIEVHAWLNPYRAKQNKNAVAAPNHVSQRLPQYAYEYGSALWMDPGAAEVQANIRGVVDDILDYDVDGIHLDDYFYPYPDPQVASFPDDRTYQTYTQKGGTLPRDEWRRANVNGMIATLSADIKRKRPCARFGVSPFGIYKPGQPTGVAGLDQVSTLFSDPLAWLRAKDVDYLAPQLYWTVDSPQQPYEALLKWWGEQTAANNAYFFCGECTISSHPKSECLAASGNC